MNKALVILAHPDDESYGPAGTLHQLSMSMPVFALVLCSGNRPGAEHVAQARQLTCTKNLMDIGVGAIEICANNDTQLEYDVAVNSIQCAVDKIQPTIVLTHDGSDLHKDHRIIHAATLVACRPTPTCSVASLYTFEIPGSTDWGFGQYGTFQPSVYVDISDYIDVKYQLLQRYTTEIREHPDCRSADSVKISAAARGKVMGMAYAEAFRLVYARGQTIW